MATNNFDPTKFGATPFNPTTFGATPANRYDPRQDPEVQRLIQEGQTAQQRLGRNRGLQYSEAFAKTLPKSIYQATIETPIKFGKSVAEATNTLSQIGPALRGGDVNIPNYGGFVSEAKTALDKGAEPFSFESYIAPATGATLAGLDTLGVTKGIQQLSKSTNLKRAVQQTMSSLTSREKKTASSRILKGSPRFGGVKEVPTSYDLEVAKEALPYIKGNPVASENNIKKAISTISQKEILPTIEKYSSPILTKDKAQLIEAVEAINPTFLTKNSPERSGIFKDFKNVILSEIGNAKDDASFFKARQIIDDIAESETGGRIWEEAGRMNPIYEIWRQSRKVFNGYLGNKIPGLEEGMRKQTLLYDALDGIAEKTGKLIGKSGTIKKLFKTGTKIAAGGAAAGAGFSGVQSLFNSKNQQNSYTESPY